MNKQEVLRSGLRFITVPMKGTKTATILVLVGTGSKYESRNNNGISHFLEHMFFKGTKKRPNSLALTSELDSVGAEFNAFTTKEFTGYWVKVDARKIELATDIVSDMLLNSKFDLDEINREKGVIIEEINMYHENPMMYIEDVFEECLYGDTPAGWEIIGPKENILRFNRKDFVDYFETHYTAKNSVVCLAGNINDDSIDKTKKYFSDFDSRDLATKENLIEEQVKPNIKLHYKKLDQANLSLGVRTVPVGHKDEMTLKIMSIILGGSMSSRLFSELREKRGLAYYVRTQSEFYTDSGYLTTQAGIPAERIKEAVEVILAEYKKLKEKLINDKELQRAKDLIQGRVTIQLEASDDMATWFAKQEVLSSKSRTPEQFFEAINKVSTGDIRRVANDIFVNNKLNLAVIGPFKDAKKIDNILEF